MDYSKSTGDLVPKIAQSTNTEVSGGFAIIKDVSIYNIAEQNQMQPRMIRTGTTRGDQQIKGAYTVADGNNTVKVLIGYKKGAF